MSEDMLRLLWGKTKDKNPSATIYHPLLFHLLDVGNAARELWQRLPRRFQQRLADALGIGIEDAERVITLLAGIHDLGKASAFQTKAIFLWKDVQAAGLSLQFPRDEPHAFITACPKVLPLLLRETTVCGWTVRDTKLANTLASITGAHHGKFPPPGVNYSPETRGNAAWDRARLELARQMTDLLFPDENLVSNPIRLHRTELTDSGMGAYLTGLIAVADWIGSSAQHFFLDSQNCAFAEYGPRSFERAQKAVTKFGWNPPHFSAPKPFEEIVWGRTKDDKPIQFSPNIMQATVARFAEEATGRPYMQIVEAAMGEGKTEAALFAADVGTTGGTHQGFYVALPTQATGNAMLRRVQAYLSERGHEGRLNLQLIHGGAEFNPDFERLRAEAREQSANGPDKSEKEGDTSDNDMRLVAESWFTSRKQSLLAPFGVGTIDQSLMGVLQTKHWFVRLFGLAGKVVVFDEVHAYDVYMGELLETLIHWLAELDCTVILLSATLPRERRETLINAFRGGAASTVVSAPYPRVTFVPRQGSGARSEGVPSGDSRTVAVSFMTTEGDESPGIAERIAHDLPRGGCAAVICNTVAQAQATYDVLQASLGTEGWTVLLFHARTPLKWRQQRENEVLARFGRESTPEQRDRQILVATQVVEQSLDLDFDWMASEMAPVDLLLQRMGRLWRHKKRTDNKERIVTGSPQFVVLCGTSPNAANPLSVFPPGSDLVYERFILLRSYMALRNRSEISLPTDIEPLVSTVYDTADVDASTLDEAWVAALTQAKADSAGARAKAKKAAEGNLIGPPPTDGGDFQDVIGEHRRDLKDDDDPKTHQEVRAVTRLGDPSVMLVCLRRCSDGRLRPFCDSADTAPSVILDNGKRPTLALVRALRESSVAIARPKALFFALTDAPIPSGWQEDTHLRYARYAIFDGDTAIVKTKRGKFTLHLNEDVGLRVAHEQTIENAFVTGKESSHKP